MLWFKINVYSIFKYYIFLKGLIGGAWIYGKVDDNGDFTGHNVAYVNQDLRTLFIGTFENGLMVRIHVFIFL